MLSYMRAVAVYLISSSFVAPLVAVSRSRNVRGTEITGDTTHVTIPKEIRPAGRVERSVLQQPMLRNGSSVAPLVRHGTIAKTSLVGGAVADVGGGRKGSLHYASSRDPSENGLVKAFFGVLLVLLAVPLQWYNEARSVRAAALFEKGLAEVTSVDASRVCKANRGRLVHVQGKARGGSTLKDAQFHDVSMSCCLKMQKTVEIFQWVQTMQTSWRDGRFTRGQPHWHTEWSTAYHNSAKFRKPSPENPLPSNKGISLGTTTEVCEIELGGFVLPKEMAGAFQKFEPAMFMLPKTLIADGLTFLANADDGYYYARPWGNTKAKGCVLTQHEVGDLRVRFLYAPETDATVVAVQCEKDGKETFVPYRPVAVGPCVEDAQAKELVVREGFRSHREMRRETSCCTGGMCCCACNTIACICAQEVVSDEICYVSDRLDPVEEPFRAIVPRNPVRVWNFRMLGIAVMFLGVRLVLTPMAEALRTVPALSVYGGAAETVMAAGITLSSSAMIVAAAASFYRPFIALRWLVAAGLIVVAPLLLGVVRDAVAK